MLRLKQRTGGVYTLSTTVRDDDGATLVPTAPSIAIKDSAGEVVEEGTPTVSDSTLSYEIPAASLPFLDSYTIVWGATADSAPWSSTEYLELVGGYLFEIPDLRASDRAFENATKYPTETLRAVRTAVEQTIEGKRAANVAFVPRGARVTVDGNGKHEIVVPHFEVREVISAFVNGWPLSPAQVASLIVDDNSIYWPDGTWLAGRKNIEIHYTHGRDVPPGPISRAALILAKEYAVKTDLPGRATATSIGDQIFRLTVAGRDGVTGLPEVDAAIGDHGRKSFGIA